jgi:hypothetical protein
MTTGWLMLSQLHSTTLHFTHRPLKYQILSLSASVERMSAMAMRMLMRWGEERIEVFNAREEKKRVGVYSLTRLASLSLTR